MVIVQLEFLDDLSVHIGAEYAKFNEDFNNMVMKASKKHKDNQNGKEK
jgi:hypothetical protein